MNSIINAEIDLQHNTDHQCREQAHSCEFCVTTLAVVKYK